MLNRRTLLKTLAATGIGSEIFRRSLVNSISDDTAITAELIKQSEWVAGLELDDEQREKLAKSLRRSQRRLKSFRETEIPFAELPSVHTQTLAERPVAPVPRDRAPRLRESAVIDLPANPEDIAFLPVTELSVLIRTRKIRSVDLTDIYLKRLKRFNPLLKCVVNLTEELAMEQAAQADKEIAAGRYRGPLHGIPWGAKDLVAVDGYPTTWGLPQFRDRVIRENATVFNRLHEAGAVLVAKLSLGAIAMGDQWFEGMTRNPWNPRQGSSGSSAGSASATAAGLVGFSIGSETLGSIVSPSRRCGTTGLRPTFGRVSRSGCMSLSWSMDKLGPITRSVEDAALVFAAIQGKDDGDPASYDTAFRWPQEIDFQKLRVGYSKQQKPLEDREDLQVFKNLGVELVEVKLPASLPLQNLSDLIGIEGAAVFESMLNQNETEGWNAWPEIFRSAQFLTALDYLRIQRMRRRLMREMETAMADVDVMVNVSDLFHTNLCGQPSVVMPVGFRKRREVNTPYSVILTGHLNQDDRLLAVAARYQDMQDAHLKRPPLEKWLTQVDEIHKKKEDSESDAAPTQSQNGKSKS